MLSVGATLTVAFLVLVLILKARQEGRASRSLPNEGRSVRALDGGGEAAWARAVALATDQAVLVIDAKDHIAWANPAANRVLGVAEEEMSLIGVHWETLFPDLADQGVALADLPRGGVEPALPSSVSECLAVRGVSVEGRDIRLELSRIDAGQDTDRPAILMMAATSTDVGTLTAMGRLSLDFDASVLSGDRVEDICALACQRLPRMEGLAAAWVALADKETGDMILTTAAGPEAGPLTEHLRTALPDDLRHTLDPVPSLSTIRTLTGSKGPAGRSGDLTPEESVRAALDRLRPGLAFPLGTDGANAGVLVVHPLRDTLDRGARMRINVIARRLGNMTALLRDTMLLRLQAAAMSVTVNAVFITDEQGRIEWVNTAFTRLSGFSAREVIGKTPHVLFSGHQDPATYTDLWGAIRRGEVWSGELVERRRDGGLYTVRQTVTPIQGPDGHSVHYVAVQEDITERKRAEERIRYLSNYDTLTRLPNRALFREHLHHAVQHARRGGGTVAVLFIDLTKFSRVNDTLGHDLGDQILMTVGSRINAAVAQDVEAVARIGGDEFALIQSGDSGAEAAAALARRVANIIATPVEVGANIVSLRATVGIAMYPDDGTDPDHLIRNADLAMHRVAQGQGEDYRFFSNDMNNDAQIRLDLETDLRRALDRHELENFYQPQYNMHGMLVGMEALVRWRHPTRGLVPPGQFIGVAEDSGLIMPLGEAVIRRALTDIDDWRTRGLPVLPVAVNVSAAQFRDGGLVERIRAALDAHGLPTDALELEITESVLMADHVSAQGFLNRLSEEGFRIAIDDFGTGYSSLSYLKRFPVHKLKIDQSFVQHLTTDNNDAILVRAIINLGHSLGLTVLAEGVETEEQFDYLRHEGADAVQGYFFGKPMPKDEMETLLRTETGRLTGRAPSSPP
jgi:diguanylate cyclase (GGDEF)-like protein/PAS domain S-box-containing protein